MPTRTKRTFIALAALAYLLSLLACVPPGPQAPTPVAQASSTSPTTPAQRGSTNPAVPPTAPSPTVPAIPTLIAPTKRPLPMAPGPSAGSGQAWTDSVWGNPARTRYNPTTLTLPLQLLWEQGDAGALVVLGDRLYVLTRQGELYVLDAAGQELAHTTVWAEACCEPPALVSTEGSLIAYTSRPVSPDPVKFLVHVVGLDRDGQRRWEVEIPDARGRPCYFLADQGLVAVAGVNWLSVRDAATGEERWRKTTEPGDPPRPLASDGATLYVAGPGLVAYDWRTGQERWRQTDERVQGARSAAVSEGRLYVLVFEGPAFALDSASGQILWQSPFDATNAWVELGDCDLAVAHGSVYVAQVADKSRKFLHALDATTGTPRWRWTAPEDKEVDVIAACQTHVLAVTGQFDEDSAVLHLLDPATAQEQDRVSLTWFFGIGGCGGGRLAIAGGRIYVLPGGLWVYGSGP